MKEEQNETSDFQIKMTKPIQNYQAVIMLKEIYFTPSSFLRNQTAKKFKYSFLKYFCTPSVYLRNSSNLKATKQNNLLNWKTSSNRLTNQNLHLKKNKT